MRKSNNFCDFIIVVRDETLFFWMGGGGRGDEKFGGKNVCRARNAKINCLHNFKTKNKLFAITLISYVCK